MPKYLAKAKYTSPDGVQGLIADGGTTRSKAVGALIESVGGTMEAMYFAFGETDAFTVFDAPDSASAAAVSLAAAASGLATVEIVQLLTAEELDAAAAKTPAYDAPGPNA